MTDDHTIEPPTRPINSPAPERKPDRVERAPGRKVEFTRKEIEILAEVESDTSAGAWYHVGYEDEKGWYCSCPDFVHRQHECKHISAVRREIRI